MKKTYTKENKEYIINNAKGISNAELTIKYNEEFNQNRTVKAIGALKKRLKVKSGLNGRFKKGQESWCKGMKGLRTGGDAGWFKKGQTAHNYKAIGSERICKKDGYIIVKVQDEGTYQERWKHKHVVVWEEQNGKVLVFLDNDRTNNDIKNLKLITRHQLAIMNKKSMHYSDAGLTNTSTNIALLESKINELSTKKGTYT